MPSKIPLKLLLQHRPAPEPGKPNQMQFRLTALVDADTIVKMLHPIAKNLADSASIRAEMPSEDMEVHLEIMTPDAEISKLTYTKHLQEDGWKTDHVTLVRDSATVE